MLTTPFEALNDPEGKSVPESMPFVVDTHVHIFPDEIQSAIWNWFDKFAWPIRYRLPSAEIPEFLLSRGVGHIVALHYAHKPGISRQLNAFMARLCEGCGQMTGTATVFPGEPDAADILTEAFESGLGGVKLHAHVQCFDMNSKEMAVIYDVCAAWDRPLVMHAGREPKSPAYACDPHRLCSADKLERVLKAYPTLRICVPHLGTDEYGFYQRLIEEYDTLWLDTAMVVTDFFPDNAPPPLCEMRPDRIMFGTDFPNIPYAWDRELKAICSAGLDREALTLMMGKNATEFFKIRQSQA